MIDRTMDVPSAWDEEVDVAVVGAGSAGLTCAVVAAAEGLSVLLLEKGDVVGGTTAVSGGGAWFPANRHTSEVGVEDSPEQALEYLRACTGENAEDEILVALVEHGPATVEFLEDRAGVFFRPWPSVGGTIDYRPWLPGAKHGGRTLDPGKFTVADLGDWGPRVRTGASSAWLIDKMDYYAKQLHTLPPAKGQEGRTRPHQLAQGEDAKGVEFFASGAALIGRLLKAALEQGATVVTDAPAEELIVEEGRVIGLRATRDGRPWLVRARRGVVMTTGGFGQNEELKRMWLTRPMEHTCEPDTITGDGHLMGAAIGAQLAQLDAWWMPKLRMGAEPQGSREDRILPHSMIVNRAGKRFVNEALNYHDVCEAFGTKEGGWARNLPAWLLFDRQARDNYILYSGKVPKGDPPPWLTVADTVEDLATALGIDPQALSDTFERFNGFAREGRDPDFGRGESGWDNAWGDPKNEPNPSLGTLLEPPFYAVEVMSGALATKGGLRVNAAGEVLSAAPPFGRIPGFYAAGNCSNAGPPVSYPGAGATVGAAMTFGYIIARELAAASEVAGVGAESANA
jgi:3-oxosteroid 1-dehydrogenase